MAKGPQGNHPTAIKQVCNLIPPHMIPKLAKKHGIVSRGISPWSHVVAMMFGQLTHALGLNDICDALRHHAGFLRSIRGARPPSRNAFPMRTRFARQPWRRTCFGA